jgi:hypothetical protein
MTFEIPESVRGVVCSEAEPKVLLWAAVAGRVRRRYLLSSSVRPQVGSRLPRRASRQGVAGCRTLR